MPALSVDPGALYARHRTWLVAHCARRLRSRVDAEDAVQQTFLYALGCLERGVTPRDEAAWLRTIADNVCRSSRRRSRSSEASAEIELVAAPERSEATARELVDAVAALPTSQREALLLREWQGLSYREIAARLDTSEAAVETLLVRARRRAAAAITERRRLLDLGSLLSGLRSLLGTAAGKAGAVAVVGSVAAGATVAAVPRTSHHAPVQHAPAPPPQRVVHEAAAPRPVPALPALRGATPHGGRFKAPSRRRPGLHVSIASVTATPAAHEPVRPAEAPDPVEASVRTTAPESSPHRAASPPARPAVPTPAAPSTTPAIPSPGPAPISSVVDAATGAADAVTGTAGAAAGAVETTASTAVGAVEATVTTAVAPITGGLPPLPGH